MAIVLQFKQGDSGTTLNLNAGEAGFQLAGQGWSPAVATPVYMGDPPPIGESIHLRLAGASHNAIATSMQSLHDMQVMAEQYMMGQVVSTPVWLHAKMANETGERRALVHSITAQYKTSWFGPQATAEDIPLVLSVVRGPYWESTSVRLFPDDEPAAAVSVKYDYTAAGTGVSAHDIVGDVGARVEDFRFQGGAGPDQLGVAWMGIRSANLRSAVQLSNFALIWELEAGTNNGNETGITDEADADASGGNVVQVVETDLQWDNTWQKVLSIDAGDVAGANADDLQGLFLWLLRTYVASGTWDVQLRYGYISMLDADYIKGRIVEVSNTGYAAKEMDVMGLPLTNIRTLDFDSDMAGGYAIQVWARRTSGSGNFFVDCLCPIPADEGFAKLSFTDTSHVVELGQDPRLVWDGVISSPTILSQLNIIESLPYFSLPPGDGYIVCVYEYVTQPDDDDTINFNDVPANTAYYERWLSLRGSE